MDYSETYIKMCDCPEIQEQLDDFEDGLNNDNCAYLVTFDKAVKDGGYPVWLPRQDQIQEMMIGHYKLKDFEFTDKKDEWVGILAEFFYFSSDYDEQWREVGKDTIHGTASMEQLWLAFYMYKKHDKTWDGNKWKKK